MTNTFICSMLNGCQIINNNPMNKLDQIKAAYEMGWAATIKVDNIEGQILRVGSTKGNAQTQFLIWELPDRGINNFTWEEFLEKEVSITGYLYAGQLAGNEPIPEGQRFRVKETNEIFSFLDFTNPPTTMDAPKLYGPIEGDKKGWGVYKPNSYFSKEEIEPVFD